APVPGDRGGAEPLRVWLGDGEGNLIDSWLIGPEVGGLDLQMLSLATPESTTLYFGIVPAGRGGEGGAIPYALEVFRGAAAFSPSAAPSPIQVDPDASGGGGQDGGPGGELGGSFGGDRGEVFGPVVMPPLGAGPVATVLPPGSSGGGGGGL